MPTIQELQGQYPALAGLDDDQVVDAVRQAFYPDLPREEIAKDLGVKLAPPPAPPPPARTLTGTIGDAAVSLARGVVGVPQAAVGIADIATGGRVGKALEEGVEVPGTDGFRLRFDPKETQDVLGSGYSGAQQAANKRFDDAGSDETTLMGTVWEKTKALVRNPSIAAHSVIESLPSIGAGGVVGRSFESALLALSPRMAAQVASAAAAPFVASAAARATAQALPMIGGAVGEGVVGAGQAAEQIRTDPSNKDRTLSGEQAGLALASGAGDTLFGMLGGKIAAHFGIHDVDTMAATSQLLQAAAVNPKAEKAIARKVLEGFISEGLLEELPQSLQEQVAQNMALGKPLDDGVPAAAVLGFFTGGLMGAGANAWKGMTEPKTPPPAPAAGTPPAAGPSRAPAPTAVPPAAAAVLAAPSADAAIATALQSAGVPPAVAASVGITPAADTTPSVDELFPKPPDVMPPATTLAQASPEDRAIYEDLTREANPDLTGGASSAAAPAIAQQRGGAAGMVGPAPLPAGAGRADAGLAPAAGAQPVGTGSPAELQPAGAGGAAGTAPGVRDGGRPGPGGTNDQSGPGQPGQVPGGGQGAAEPVATGARNAGVGGQGDAGAVTPQQLALQLARAVAALGAAEGKLAAHDTPQNRADLADAQQVVGTVQEQARRQRELDAPRFEAYDREQDAVRALGVGERVMTPEGPGIIERKFPRNWHIRVDGVRKTLPPGALSPMAVAAPTPDVNVFGVPVGYTPNGQERVTAGDLKAGDWISSEGKILNVVGVEPGSAPDKVRVTLGSVGGQSTDEYPRSAKVTRKLFEKKEASSAQSQTVEPSVGTAAPAQADAGAAPVSTPSRDGSGSVRPSGADDVRSGDAPAPAVDEKNASQRFSAALYHLSAEQAGDLHALLSHKLAKKGSLSRDDIPVEMAGDTSSWMLLKDAVATHPNALIEYLQRKAGDDVPRETQSTNEPEVAAAGSSEPIQRASGVEPGKAAPLYAQRKVLNPAAIIAWAKSQGIANIEAADKLHVTIAYSKADVDPGKVGNTSPAYDKGRVTGTAGRKVEYLGDGGALVLKFDSPVLATRWAQFKKAGASWDYEGYQPHITIAYHEGRENLLRVQPYTGPIELGPEIQEPLDDEPKEQTDETGATARDGGTTQGTAAAAERDGGRDNLPAGAQVAGDAVDRNGSQGGVRDAVAAPTTPRVVINKLGPDGLTDEERAAGKKPYTDAPAADKPMNARPERTAIEAAQEQWWDKYLTSAGRSDIMKANGVKLPAMVKWMHMSPENQAKVDHMRPSAYRPAPAAASEFSDLEKSLQSKAHDTEQPGDVGVVVAGGKVRFVAFDDAVQAARAALAAGTRAVPFQIHDATGIRLGDTDRVLAAASAPAPKPDKAEIRPYRKPDGSIGYEAVPIQAPAAAPAAPKESDLDEPEGRDGWKYVTSIGGDDGVIYQVDARDIQSSANGVERAVRQIRVYDANSASHMAVWEWRAAKATDEALSGLRIDSATFHYVMSNATESAFGEAATDGDALWARYGREITGALKKSAAAPATESPKKLAISANTVFTEDAAAAARARLKAKLGRVGSGLDPEMMLDGITLAGYHIEKGARTFAAYAKAMLEDMGEAIRPYLKQLYMAVKYDPRAGSIAKDMSSAAFVDEFDIASIAQPSDAQHAQQEDTGEAEASTDQPQEKEPLFGANDDTGRNAASDAGLLADAPSSSDAEDDPGADAGASDGVREADADGDGHPEGGRDGRGDGVGGSEGTVLHGSAAEPEIPAEVRPLADGPLSHEHGERQQPLSGENPGNFVITEDFGLGEGGDGQKIEANLQAIRTLRKVQAEHRYPTRDEQTIMARYVGWGGLKNAFDSNRADSNDMFGRAYRELKSLLSPAEFNDAAASIRNAHYTAKGVVDAMWRVARFMGFKGGRVLEPTVGIGNFMGLQPEDLAAATEWHASELDTVTGQMAAMIYPEANVLAATGFQDAPFADGAFDLAIGNPPFGSAPITDKTAKRKHLSGMKVHNYIIAKAGMHLRPGGVMSMVVTHRFLDTANPEARDVLAKDFRFLGAFRLPNDAFAKNAGTQVVTDVIFLQKLRADEKRDRESSWLDTDGKLDGDIRVNRYYQENPTHILGRSAMDGSMYGRAGTEGEYTVHSDGRDLGKAIDELLGAGLKHLSGVLERTAADMDLAPAMLEQSDLPIGGVALMDDGRILRRELNDDAGNAVVTEISPETLWKEQAAEWDALRDAVQAVKDRSAAGKLTAEDAQNVLTFAGFLYNSKGEPESKPSKAQAAVYALVEDLAKTGSFAWKHDEALGLIDKALENRKLGEDGHATLKAMLDLRNRTLALIRAERSNDKRMEMLRAQLNASYDKFVKEHGHLTDPKVSGLLAGDIGAESGLESGFKAAISPDMAKRTGQPVRKASASKADILARRVNFPYKPIDHADTAGDALVASLIEYGRVNVPYMAQITGKSALSVINDLSTGENPQLFFDPEAGEDGEDGSHKGEYQEAERYLSGNVRHKLEVARKQRLQTNVRALEKVQPAPKTKAQVKPNIRGLWMPAEIFQEFLQSIGYRDAHVTVIPSQGIMVGSGNLGGLTEFGIQFRNQNKSPLDMFNAAATGKSLEVWRGSGDTRVKDETATKEVNAQAERMGKVFQAWAYSTEERSKRIVDAFNEKMNTHAPRKWDGEKYLRTVGASPSVKLRRTQKNAAWRMIQSASTLLDHVVGAGKTYTIVAAVMERRRMGLSRKPMIAVPNHLVTQWAQDFYRLYPGARVLAATPADFAKKNRRRLLARIATGDYDAIIIGHSSMGFIEQPQEDQEMVVNEKLDELREALDTAKRDNSPGGNRTRGQIEDKIARYEQKLADLADRKVDEIGLDFKSMGVDFLAVDEAHEFKNLEYSTSGERVVGMNDPKGSKKAFDLYVKIRGVQARKGAVAFATGTPVSNSLVEIYTVMSYLGTEALKLRNQAHFDAWSAAYAATETRLEYTATQKLKPRRVLAGLNNLSALRQLYEEFSDIITMADLKRIYAEEKHEANITRAEIRKLPEGERDAALKAAGLEGLQDEREEFPVPKVKGGQRQFSPGEITPAQREYMDYLVARMMAIEGATDKKAYARIDNPLWVLSDARKMSLDIRVVDPSLPRDPEGKVARASTSIKATYDKWAEERGTQLVFCDLSTPAKASVKNAGQLVNKTIEKLYSSKDAKRVKAEFKARGLSFEDQWTALTERAEAMMESPATPEDKRDAIQEYLDGLEDPQATMLTADIGFSVYDDVRAALVEKGVPETEIAFIHDYNTPEEKAKLFERVNAGYVRVLMGSSQKMGAGTNAQRRLVKEHHMDAPWRPSDVEQREGRIIRQGNMFYERDPDGFEVEIETYSTSSTSDTVMWQILNRKAAAIEQFRQGGLDEVVEEGGDSDQYAEFMATSTGNPVFRLKLESERRLTEMEAGLNGALITKGNAQAFLSTYAEQKAKAERERDAAKSFDASSTASYGGETGSAAEFDAAMEEATADYNAKYAEFQEKFEAWKLEVKKWEAEPEATRGKKPKAPVMPGRPHLMTQSIQDASGWARAVAKALKEAKVGKSVSITFGKDSKVTIEGEPVLDTTRWIAHTRIGGVLFELATSGAKTPDASENIRDSLTPGSLTSEFNGIAKRRQDTVDYLDSRRKDAEHNAAREVDTRERDAAREELYWYTAQVAFAETQSDIDRGSRPNRFIAKDRRRPLGNRARVTLQEPKAVEVGGKGYITTGLFGRAGWLTVLEGTDPSGAPVVLLQKPQTAAQLKAGSTEFDYEVTPEPASIREARLEREFLEQAAKDVHGRMGLGNVSDVVFGQGGNTAAGGGMAPAKVQGALDQVAAGWTNAPVLVALKSADDAPPEVVRDLREREAAGGGRGRAVLYRNTAYFFSDTFANEADVATYLYHEVLGHFGLRGHFGRKLDQELTKVAHLHPNAVKRMLVRMGKADTPDNRIEAAEEIIVYAAQNQPGLGIVKRVIAAIRNYLRDNIPLFKNMRFTDADIIQKFILPARRFVEGGDGGPRGGQSMPEMSAAFAADDFADRNDGEQPGALSDAEVALAPALAVAMRRWQQGRIGERDLAAAIAAQLQTKRAQREERIDRDRVRGPDWIRERLFRSRRQQELNPGMVDLALWLIDQAPHLATDLGLSVRTGGNADLGPNGTYNVVERVVTLFTDSGSDDTAVHEILHHTERMMPRDVQNGIRREWVRQLDRAVQQAKEQLQAAPKKAPAAPAGWGSVDTSNEHDNVQEQLLSMEAMLIAARQGDADLTMAIWRGAPNLGPSLSRHLPYQLSTPSEFWAVNGARIIHERAVAAGGGWIDRAVHWLGELVQRAKSLLGLRSDAPVLRGLQSIINGDGTYASPMLAHRRDGIHAAQGIHARKIQVDGKWRPIDNSKGQIVGKSFTEQANFWMWFGESKAVDAEGRPLALYHGTNSDFSSVSEDASREDGAFFVSNSTRVASDFALYRTVWAGANVMPVYVKAGKLLEVDGQGLPIRGIENMITLPGQRYGETMRDFARREGYDGIRFKDVRDDVGPDIAPVADVYALFKTAQIKSATGNAGTFDASNPSILFSQDMPLNDPRAYWKMGREWVDEFGKTPGKLHWWHKSLGTQYNLAQKSLMYKRVFDGVQDFLQDVSLYATEAADRAPLILPQLDSWRDLLPKALGGSGKKPMSVADNKAVREPIIQGTLEWTRDKYGNPVRVDDMRNAAKAMTPEEKAQQMVRNNLLSPNVLKMWQGLPHEQFAAMVETRYESTTLKAGIVWTDTELRKHFNLSDQQILLYRQFRGSINESITRMALSGMVRMAGKDASFIKQEVMGAHTVAEGKDILVEQLKHARQDEPERSATLQKLSDDIEDTARKALELMDRGYAPLMRFGHYTVTVRGMDENGEPEVKFFGMYESALDARLAEKRLAEAFAEDNEPVTIARGTQNEEAYKLFAGVSPETAELFGEMLGLNALGDTAADQAFQQWLKLAKASRSAMKRMIHRKGTAGFSEDMSRVLAAFVYSNARQTSRALHSGEIDEAIQDIEPSKTGQGELQRQAIRLREYVNNPGEEAHQLRGLLFAQYLGGSIAAALVNMTQPFQMTMPYLSQFGGIQSSVKRMGWALTHAWADTTGDDNMDRDLKRAVDEGIVAPQEVHQLMAQAQGRGHLRAGDGSLVGNSLAAGANLTSRVMAGWGKPFATAELFNRRVTFVAAYKTALEEGISNPFEFSKKAVIETQGLYNKGNRPAWSRGALGATLMTFKQYGIAYLEFVERMWNAGEPGSPERAAGRRAVFFAAGMILLMAGAGGFPFVEDVEDLVDGIMQRLGYNWQSKEKVRELLQEAFGKAFGGFLEKGVSGLPGAPIDVAGRLGLGNLIPGTGAFQKKEDRSRDVLELAGPTGDLAKRVAQGLDTAASGDVIKGGMDAFAPKAIRDLRKAIDMLVTGEYRDDRGYRVTDTTAADALAKLVGFQPGAVAQVQSGDRAAQAMVALARLRESEIAAKWAQAMVEHDQGAQQEARRDLADWNAKNQSTPIKIRLQDVLRRAQKMRLSRAQRIEKSAPSEVRQEAKRMMQQ